MWGIGNTERSLETLERHRLTAFYEDGEEHMKGAMRLREILAMKQYLSDTPIKPYQVIRELFETAAPALSIEARRVPSKQSIPRVEAADAARTERQVEVTLFSFIKATPDRVGMMVEFGLADSIDQYSIAIGCCDNPACECRAVDLRLVPLGKPPATAGIHFRLLIDEKVIQSPPGFRGMGEALSARFTENDWSAAGRVYAEMKAEVSEPADVSGLDMSFPDEVLKDPSVLVAYQEVLRHARDPYFEHERKLWIVREWYCSNPDCSCADIVLDFASQPDEVPPADWVIHDKNVSTVFFNYRTGAFKAGQEWPSDSPKAGELMATLQSAWPGLADRFERRQRILRALHGKARNKIHPATQGRQRIGRNEPCPCGSRKKYKLCCGR